MLRSRVLIGICAGVVGVALLACCVVPAVRGQEQPREKHVVGAVVSTEAENTKVTVKADETGEVIVLHAGWRQREGGNWERNAEHIHFIAGLEKGDRVEAGARFGADGEIWIIQEISRLDGGGGEGDGDIAALRREVASLREQIVALQREIAELKALVRQLVEK